MYVIKTEMDVTQNFDCVTDLPNGKYCTTGMCPGDDDKASWKNQEFVGCDKDNDKDNKKSSISSDCNYNGLNVSKCV
jgi:hypothetical protein